jgi:septum formation protein
MPLWLAEKPLVLASKSASRRALLEAAGVPVETHPADIDERGIEERAALSGPGEVAALLAREKAKAVAAQLPDRIVVGADQTLALGARRFSKPKDRDAAAGQLRVLRGETHALHSAVAVMHGGNVVFDHVGIARLTMRDFSEDFLQAYLDAAGPKVTTSVGAYQLEGFGIQLFAAVQGEHSTILGLPLISLLDFLRRERLLSA